MPDPLLVRFIRILIIILFGALIAVFTVHCQYEYPYPIDPQEGFAPPGYQVPYQQPSYESQLTPIQRADLLIAQLGSYDQSQRSDAQSKLLELGRQMLSQGDQANFKALLDKLDYASLRGDSDAITRARSIASDLRALGSTSAGEGASGEGNLEAPFYEDRTPFAVEGPLEPEDFPGEYTVGPGPLHTYPGEAEYESEFSFTVITSPQIQDKLVPLCSYPDIDVKIEHTLKNNREGKEEFHVHPAGGVGSIVGYMGTDEKIIDNNKFNQQIRNDFLDKVIHKELKDAAMQDKIDNKKVNSLFNRSVIGAAYAGCSGMSAAARGLALGKVVKVMWVPPGTPGVPEKGGPGFFKDPADPKAKEVPGVFKKLINPATGQEITVFASKEIGRTSADGSINNPIEAGFGNCQERVTIAPKFSLNENERRFQSVTIISSALVAGQRYARVSSRVGDVNGALTRFADDFKGNPTYKETLKDAIKLAEDASKDPFEGPFTGNVEALASSRLDAKISCTGDEAKKDKLLEFKGASTDVKINPYFPQIAADDNRAVPKCAAPASSAVVSCSRQVMGTDKDLEKKVIVHEASASGLVRNFAIHRAVSEANVTTYYAVVWVAILTCVGDSKIKVGAHVHGTGFSKPPSDEFFVEDKMVTNLSQYLKSNGVVVNFDPKKPRDLLDPKPGVTKNKVQTALESYLKNEVYKAVDSSFFKCR